VAEPVVEIEVEIRNENGLHLRPAMQFVDLATQFASAIAVGHDKLSADGKSIMQMATLTATCGTRLKIRAQGPDAAEAIAALKKLVEEELPKQPAEIKDPKKEG